MVMFGTCLQRLMWRHTGAIFALIVFVNACLPALISPPTETVSYGYSFVEPSRQPAEALPEITPLAGKVLGAAASRPQSVDCRVAQCVALTFDDGPNPDTTGRILDELQRHKAQATFYVLGKEVAGRESLLQRMYAAGHEIGNHSWDHPSFDGLSPEQMLGQIEATQQAIVAAGLPAPTMFRPPYGAINSAVVQTVPMSILLWNEDPRDWAASSPDQIIQSVLNDVRPGAVVVMHDVYNATADSLPRILDELALRGYQFVTVSDMLDLPPDARGLFYGQYTHPRP